jgi:ADP-ribose pyrophosphatase
MKLFKKELIYSGKIIQLYLEEWTDEEICYLREIIHHPGAVAVLPVYGESVILVRQYRHAIKDYLLEIPAGLIEPQENPEETARREVEEETGFAVNDLKKLAELYSSPGTTDEVLHLYLASVKPSSNQKNMPDQDEKIDVLIMHQDEFLRLAERGELKDSKTLIAALFLAKSLKDEAI